MADYTLCDCDWTPDGVPEQPCGCGEHAARLYRDTVYHYDGKHWRADCLIRQFARERDELKRRVEELDGEPGAVSR